MPSSSNGSALPAIAATLLLAVAGHALSLSPAAAQDIGMRVVGVAFNDVLNIWEYPGAQHRYIGMIPPNGRGVVFRGQRVGEWVFVTYGNVTGWVNSRYLVPEVAGWVSRGYRH